MTPKIIIQTPEDLYLDRFANCILVDFSCKVEDTKSDFSTHYGEYVEDLQLNSNKNDLIGSSIVFMCVDYESSHIKQSQRINLAA